MENAQTYKGQQIVLSSGRLLLNARSDSVFITSQKYINLSAGDKVTIDVGPDDSDNEENMFLVNAPKIQFGLDRRGTPVEPIVKGDKLEEILNELIEILIDYSDLITSSVPPYTGQLSVASELLKKNLNNIRIDFPDMKSNTTYTI